MLNLEGSRKIIVLLITVILAAGLESFGLMTESVKEVMEIGVGGFFLGNAGEHLASAIKSGKSVGEVIKQVTDLVKSASAEKSDQKLLKD